MNRLLAIALLLVATPAAAQDAEQDEKQIRALLVTLRGHYKERDWKQLESHMTDEGYLSFKRTIVQMTFPFLGDVEAFPFANSEETREKVAEAYREHGVREIDLPSTTFDFDPTNKELFVEYIDTMLAAADRLLDQSMNHDGLMNSILDATKEVPYMDVSASMFGFVKSMEMEETEEGVLAVIKFKPPPPPEEVGEGVRISAAPVAIRFVRVDDSLRYGGVDIVRTMEELFKFSPQVVPIDIDD